MKAVIVLDVPEWQIGEDVTVHFPDTMIKRGKCELLKEELPNRMTNKEWLSSLPADKFYDAIKETEHTKARFCTDSRLFMIEWLDKEHADCE